MGKEFPIEALLLRSTSYDNVQSHLILKLILEKYIIEQPKTTWSIGNIKDAKSTPQPGFFQQYHDSRRNPVKMEVKCNCLDFQTTFFSLLSPFPISLP
jgi:hypothetical protein